jgi:hypothetical protein
VGAVISHPPGKKYVYRPWQDFAPGETLTGTLIFPPKLSKNREFFLTEVEHAEGECLCGCAPGNRTGFSIVAMIDEVRFLHVGTRIRLTMRGKKATLIGRPMWHITVLVARSSVVATT